MEPPPTMPLEPISSSLQAVLRGRKAGEECKKHSPDLRSVTVLKWLGQTCAKGKDRCLTVLHRVKGCGGGGSGLTGFHSRLFSVLLKGAAPPTHPRPCTTLQTPYPKGGARERV